MGTFLYCWESHWPLTGEATSRSGVRHAGAGAAGGGGRAGAGRAAGPPGGGAGLLGLLASVACRAGRPACNRSRRSCSRSRSPCRSCGSHTTAGQTWDVTSLTQIKATYLAAAHKI